MPQRTSSDPIHGRNRNTAPLLLASIAAGIALTWLLWPNNTEPAVPLSATNKEGATQSAPSIASTTGADLPNTARDLYESKRTEVPANQRADSNSTPKLCLIVKDAETLDPVAGAAVHYMLERVSWLQLNDQDRLVVDTGDWLEWCRDLGETKTTNAAGCIWVERGTYLGVACETRSADAVRYGQLTLGGAQCKEPGPFLLLLHKGVPTEVQVVDSAGKPQPYFPIRLRPLRGGKVAEGKHPSLRHTGADGSWHIRDRQALIEAYWEESDEAPFDGIEVRLGIPLPPSAGNGPTAIILFAVPPSSPFVLIAPDTGSVILRARGPLGRSIGRYGDHRLAEKQTYAWIRGNVPMAGNHDAKFLYVPLGLTLIAEAWIDGADFSETGLEFIGPQTRGQIIDITLRARVEKILVMGTLIDTKGNPIANKSFRLQLASGDMRIRPHATTQNDGSFLLTISTKIKDRPLDLAFIQVVTEAYTLHEQNLNIGGTVAIDQLRQGLNEIGTIEIGSLPVIAAGQTIVDGTPATATVYAEWLPFERGPNAWDRMRGTTIETTKDGIFTLHGLAPRARGYRLFGYLPAAILPPSYIDVVVGQTNIDLPVTLGGEMVAEVVLDPGIDAKDIICQLTPVRRTKKALDALNYMWRSPYGRRQAAEEKSARALWRWQGLQPGDYQLKVMAAGCHQPLVVLTDLEVLPGDTCSDARLHPIDLRGLLIKTAVTVTNPSGESLNESAFVHSAKTPMLAVQSVRGVAQIVGIPPMDLMVRAAGYHPERLGKVTGPCTITLRPLPQVTVKIAPVAIPAGWRAFVSASVESAPSTIKVLRNREPSNLETSLAWDQAVEIGQQVDLKIPANPGAKISLRAYVKRVDNDTEQHVIDLGSRANMLALPSANSPIHLTISAANIQAATHR